MSVTERKQPAGADRLGGMLAGLESKWENLDPRARQQVALLAFGRRSNARPAMAVLMQDAVSLAAEVLDADLSGVAEVNSDGTRLALKLTATATGGPAAKGWTQDSPLAADSMDGNSMAAFTLNSASPIVSADIAAEKRFIDLFLRKLGVQSALNVPLHLNTEPCGVLGLYRKGKRPFTPDDVQFAETIASLLVASIARVKAEEALREQQAFASALLAMVDGLVITLDSQGHVVDTNRACEAATGFASAEIQGKAFCSVFAVPEEADSVEGVLRRAMGGQMSCKFESQLLAKDGSRRQVAWTMRVMYDGNRRVQSLVLSGTDRTEQLQMQTELQQVKALVEESGRADREEPPQPFEQLGSPRGVEMRSSPRRVFQHQQWIGPMIGTRLPQRDDFFEVVCEDISAGGISFLMDQPPRFQRMIVALGKPPALTYFTASVARVVEKTIDGQKRHLVGCRFTGRIQWDGPDLTAE
jgi:PAS domain S-box-containing protein